MAFNIDMSPLERSSLNMMQGLGNLGASVRQRIDHNQQQQSANRALATAEVIEAIHLAPDEQKQAIFDSAVTDDRYDIDEDDRPFFMDENARRAAVAHVKGDDYAKQFFGAQSVPMSDYQREDLQLKREKFAAEQESSDSPTPMTEYQREMVKNKKVDQDLRRIEVENKKLENSLKRETNELKIEEIKQRISTNKNKQMEIGKAKTEAAQSVVDSGASTLGLINEIENHPGFADAIGFKGASSLFGAFDDPISGTDAAGVTALIETLEAQNFLTAISQFKSAGGAGALSDNEGKKLGAALSNLKTAQSEKDFKKSLGIIRGLVKKQMSQAKGQINPELLSATKDTAAQEGTQSNEPIDFSKFTLEQLKQLRSEAQ